MFEKVGTCSSLAEIYMKLSEGFYVQLNDFFYFIEDNKLKYIKYKKDSITRVAFDTLESLSLWKNFTFPCDFFWKKEVHWYDNIPPQGILCRIPKRIGFEVLIIQSYDPNSSHPFMSLDGLSEKSAIPFTLEEVKQYIYNPDNNE
jgi:hypothetical protein